MVNTVRSKETHLRLKVEHIKKKTVFLKESVKTISGQTLLNRDENKRTFLQIK